MLKKFIFNTIIIIIITTLLCVSVFELLFPTTFIWFYCALPVLFGLINVFIYKYLIQTKESSLLKFSNRYLLITTLKLLGSILFIIVFLLFNKEQAILFLSTFFILYLVFLTQEIIAVLNFFKKNTKSELTQTKT